MATIKYFKDTGLCEQSIVVMGDKSQIDLFLKDLPEKHVFYIPELDGGDVLVENEAGLYRLQHVSMEQYEINETIEKGEGVLESEGPSHNYIDLNSGFTLVVSKDEYTKTAP